ncbi:MAG: type II/IV secretion system protein [Mesorhizobium sp.]|uniref:GspE/PulE family protein n=1 Tax=Mesorhizobium sp. TaxID=1871066 RepID=UPI000FEA0FCE|nr:GspE/PulE family protein [Mesorhizobium sp.]RWM12887.1 MAG: type II/IV secretion system protein [Mesorhizobium sp.]
MNAISEVRQKHDFIDHLVGRGLLHDIEAQRVLAALEATGHPLDTVLIELGLMREEAFAAQAAQYFGTTVAESLVAALDPDRSAAIGLNFLVARAIVPLRGDDGASRIKLAVADPFDRDALAMVEYLTDCPLDLCIAHRSTIGTALSALAQQSEAKVDGSQSLLSSAYEGDLERLRDFAQQAPIVRLVAKIAQIAFDDGATDIHFEPFEHTVRVRIRVDGELRPIETVSAGLLPGIATRIKILSGLDISERRLPQDGRMRLAVRGQEIDLRVSIVPTIHGETIVLRILDRSTVALDLASLGFDREAQDQLIRLSAIPNGILLVTGPTGSGKTTTLYSLISILNKPGVKIFTVEDPVEYQMAGVTQLQTNVATGLTFARALRSVLRQDPDIILVGEIRDKETAEIAMQAALTGHLVLSTLHTNSAVGAVTRLRDMGIENYQIGATVKCVLGQRLLRKLCSCAGADGAVGCLKCGGTGYKGRTVTHETVEISPAVAAQISSGMNEEDLELALRRGGFVPMDQHAMSLVKGGVTSLAEITRVVRLDGGGDG